MSLFVVNSSVSPPPTNTAGVSAALLNAITPTSLARASVTQQTFQQLSLRLNDGSQVTLDTPRLADTGTKPQYRTAVMAEPNQSALLFSASQHTQSVPVSDTQLNRLIDHISRLYTSASDAQLSIKAQITAVRPEAISLQLTNGQTLTVPVRLSPTHVGEQVTVDVTRQDGNTRLSITGSGAQSSLNATLTSPDKSMVRDVIGGALRNAGVSLDAKAVRSWPEPLAAIVAKTTLPGHTVQHQVSVAEKGGKLNVQSGVLAAIGRFSAPSSTPAEVLGRVDSGLIDKAAINRLPQLTVSEPGIAKGGSPPTQSVSLSSQQRGEVHQQIIALSRQLLSETGSTRVALNQLLTVLDKPAPGASQATQALLTTLQTRVRGLEQGINFSTFTPQPRSASEAAPPLSAAVSSNKTNPQPGNLLGTMTQRMKDFAALLSQPVTPQQPGDVTAQSKSAGAVMPLPQSTGEQVKALLNATPLPLSQSTLLRPSGGNDLVGALVTMLQFSLAGRAISRQPSLARQADRADSVLTKSLTNSPAASAGSPSRVAQDMSQMDSRGMLMQSLKTLLSNHQQSRLTNADNRLQGQDSLYYMLPMTGSEGKPPEILIRRDQQGRSSGNEPHASSRSWHLTMKLDIGEVGELLAKSRINDQSIELDLYVSSDPLLHLVADTLPFFTRKLEGYGLDVSRTSFQRGKVPATLRDQPHHIFETMV